MSCYFDKVPFPSEGMAAREAHRLNCMPSSKYPVHAFQCQNCGLWHIGGEHSKPVHFLVRMTQAKAT